jgi:hypothetical protein
LDVTDSIARSTKR